MSEDKTNEASETTEKEKTNTNTFYGWIFIALIALAGGVFGAGINQTYNDSGWNKAIDNVRYYCNKYNYLVIDHQRYICFPTGVWQK